MGFLYTTGVANTEATGSVERKAYPINNVSDNAPWLGPWKNSCS
jgi:hypothetical protein